LADRGIFQRSGVTEDWTRYKNHRVPENVGIATDRLIAAMHPAGLICPEHMPNPRKFLGSLGGSPDQEKPVIILPVGYPVASATVPAVAKRKQWQDAITTVLPAS
jgi:hypothetical protein